MYYTDFITDQILVANIDGTGSQPLLEDDLDVPGQSTCFAMQYICISIEHVSICEQTRNYNIEIWVISPPKHCSYIYLYFADLISYRGPCTGLDWTQPILDRLVLGQDRGDGPEHH